MTLPELEQLIYNYIGKRKFRRARERAFPASRIR